MVCPKLEIVAHTSVLTFVVSVAVGFAFCMGRVYSLTMFYNLNTRKGGRNGSGTGHTHTTGDLRSTTINFSTIRTLSSQSNQ